MLGNAAAKSKRMMAGEAGGPSPPWRGAAVCGGGAGALVSSERCSSGSCGVVGRSWLGALSSRWASARTEAFPGVLLVSSGSVRRRFIAGDAIFGVTCVAVALLLGARRAGRWAVVLAESLVGGCDMVCRALAAAPGAAAGLRRQCAGGAVGVWRCRSS